MSVTHTNPVNGHRPPRKQALLATGFLLTFSVEGEANKAVLMGSGLVISFFCLCRKESQPPAQVLDGDETGGCPQQVSWAERPLLVCFPWKKSLFYSLSSSLQGLGQVPVRITECMDGFCHHLQLLSTSSP